MTEPQLNSYLQVSRMLVENYDKAGKKEMAHLILANSSKFAELVLKTASWNIKPFTCIVCNKGFDDLWYHLSGKREGLLKFKDKIHEAYYIMIERSTWHKPCFCGGHITIRGTGEDSWQTTCDNCEFLYDED